MSDLPFTVGVELEVAHIRVPETSEANYRGVAFDSMYEEIKHRGWVLKTDASCGYEIVSPILKTEDDLQVLKKVVKYARSKGATVNQQCGLHVHIGGFEHMNPTAINRLLRFFVRYETAIYALAQSDRRTNNFCTPIPEHIVQKLQNKENGFDAWNIDHQLHSRHNNRYTWLNGCSFQKYGTLEFRVQGGTLDSKLILGWIDLILHLCNYVARDFKGDVRSYKAKGKHVCHAIHDLLQRGGCYGESLKITSNKARAVRARKWVADRYHNLNGISYRTELNRLYRAKVKAKTSALQAVRNVVADVTPAQAGERLVNTLANPLSTLV